MQQTEAIWAEFRVPQEAAAGNDHIINCLGAR